MKPLCCLEISPVCQFAEMQIFYDRLKHSNHILKIQVNTLAIYNVYLTTQ